MFLNTISVHAQAGTNFHFFTFFLVQLFIFLSLTLGFFQNKKKWFKITEPNFGVRKKNQCVVHWNALWPVVKQMYIMHFVQDDSMSFVFSLSTVLFISGICFFTLHFTFSADLFWKQCHEIYSKMCIGKIKMHALGNLEQKYTGKYIYIKLNIEMKGIYCIEWRDKLEYHTSNFKTHWIYWKVNVWTEDIINNNALLISITEMDIF